jgi:hypothetical protein
MGGSVGIGGSSAEDGGSAGDDSLVEDGGSAGDGSAGGADSGPECNLTGSPLTDDCLVSDSHAVFVQANEGTMAGEGTMGSPFGSFDQAIERASAEQKIIIACQSNVFFRPLEIMGPTEGSNLRIFGGFDCNQGWVRSGAPTLVTPAAGPALRIQGALGVEIVNFRFVSAAGRDFGESSVAAVVASSSAVVLRNVTLDAGEGVAGLDGSPPPQRLAPAPEGNDGNIATGGPEQNACDCSESVGGRGGDLASTSTRNGEDGRPPTPGSGEGGDGGINACSNGGRGGPGPAAATAKGAQVHGTIEDSAWRPAPGDAGGKGAVGQGGGGGGGGSTGAGGSGGCGGCGGNGGSPGQGGGGSIGLLMIDSTVTFYDCEISTSDAGAGGDGRLGQLGQVGGSGGSGADTTGCNGGPGGTGGDGATAGSGAGGISVGVVYQGTAPLNADQGLAVVLGVAGPGGAGVGVAAGFPGVSEKILKL